MHYDLTVANARSWQWWRAAGGNYKDGLIRMYVRGERSGGRGQRREMVQNNMVRDSKLMWTMGNFSRFVRPGAVRLDMEGTMEVDGLMLSAYKNTDGTLAIVAINYGKEERPINIDLSALSSRLSANVTAYRTSDVEGECLKNVGKVDLKKTVLPARSVTTFVAKK
jgi:O-glycosyl hydrolase